MQFKYIILLKLWDNTEMLIFLSLFLRLGYWSLERLINTPFVEQRFEFILSSSKSKCLSTKSYYLFLSFICVTLCNPMECSQPGSSVHGIPQAKILEWVPIPFSRRYSWPRDQTRASHIAGRFFTVWTTKEVPCPFHFFKSYYLSIKRLWENKNRKWIRANVYSVWYCLLASTAVIFMDILLFNTQPY